MSAKVALKDDARDGGRGAKVRRGGTWLGRLNRRHPWLKVVVLLITVEVGLGVGVLEPMLQSGALRLEIPVGEKVESLQTNEGASGKADAGAETDSSDSEASGEGDQGDEAVREELQVMKERSVTELVGKKLVALTFDDGPDAEVTGKVLDALKSKGVRATFFVVGSRLRDGAELAKRAEQEGHEVESHSMGHRDMSTMTAAEVQVDAATMEQLFMEKLGHRPMMLRPPYGAVNQAVRNLSIPLMLWSVDTQDWGAQTAAEVRAAAMGAVFDGAVILMHDTHAVTAEAVAGLVDELRGQGYELVTVAEMVRARGETLRSGVLYGNFKLE